MPLYAELTREIEEAPSGPETAAFFDLDRTLIAGFSALAFVRDGLRRGRFGPAALFELAMAAISFELGTIGFSAFMTGSARLLSGLSEREFVELAELLFDRAIATEIFPEARAIVSAHRRRGHTLAVVSSATSYQVRPVARELGIAHVLATRLEVDRFGRLTGEVSSPACYGEGKAVAARELAARLGLDLERSYFYTDSHEDLPLLEAVGHPRPTNPNRELQRIAARRGWPARHFTRRGLPTLGQIARTGLALGSLLPSLLAGLPALYLDDDWQRVINIAASTWGELATMFAGIEVRVEGEEHLWSRRPAVFIFNHQSGLDMLLVCKLLRRDFVGIGKQELRRVPLIGPAMALAGTVFIDRADRRRAIEALEPAVEALRRGLSLAIAPEGTRSATPRVGPFKKGAFRMAMEARVPIVPIVFRNTLDALPRDGLVVRPTTVEVVVLPPIETEAWTRESLEERIAEIRSRYVAVLAR